MTTKMYTVLGRGEAYQEEFKKKRPGGGGTTLRSLEETQQKLTPQDQIQCFAVFRLYCLNSG